jgi:hypothetical protein
LAYLLVQNSLLTYVRIGSVLSGSSGPHPGYVFISLVSLGGRKVIWPGSLFCVPCLRARAGCEVSGSVVESACPRLLVTAIHPFGAQFKLAFLTKSPRVGVKLPGGVSACRHSPEIHLLEGWGWTGEWFSCAHGKRVRRSIFGSLTILRVKNRVTSGIHLDGP